MGKNILFISVDTIKARTGLHNNVDEKLVHPEIMTAQDMYLLPCLGSALYNRIQTGIELSNLNANESDLLDTYITPALVYFVMSELPMGISYQFYNKGVVRKTETNSSEPSAQDLVEVANRYRARAEFYKQRLIKYLQQSVNSNLFPEYTQIIGGIDTIYPDKTGYTISIYLGEKEECKDMLWSDINKPNNKC